MLKPILCVVYTYTSECARSLSFAANLHRKTGGEKVRIYLQTAAPVRQPEYYDGNAANLMQLRQVERVRQDVLSKTGLSADQIEVVPFERTADIVFPDGALLIGAASGLDRRDVSVLTAFDEDDIDARGKGPVFVPFGDNDSAVEAAQVALPMAGALDRNVVFWHTTWKDAALPPDAPPEAHISLRALQVRRCLEAMADAQGIKYSTIIETADDIAVALLQAAARARADIIAVARGRKVRSGSCADRLSARSAIPLLTVVARYDTSWRKGFQRIRTAKERCEKGSLQADAGSNRPHVRTLLSQLAACAADPVLVMVVVALMYIAKVVAKSWIGSTINSPMIAGDGLHNFADFFEALAVIAVILVARRPSSERYPYGRKNIEFFTALAIGIVLMSVSATFAVKSAVGLIASFPHLDATLRSYLWLPAHESVLLDAKTFPWVLAITASSVVLSVAVSRYQIAVGRVTQHDSLVADGEETLSDGKIEAVTLLGILGEFYLGASWLEYPLGLLVAYLIACTGRELFIKAWRVLLQHSIGVEHDSRIAQLCLSVKGIDDVQVKTFQVGRIAVCHLNVTTPRGAEAIENIKYAIETAVDGYVLAQDFISCETHINFQMPAPRRDRMALAVARKDGVETIVARIEEATHLVVCDMEFGAVAGSHEVSIASCPDGSEDLVETTCDVPALLKKKQIHTLWIFDPHPDAGFGEQSMALLSAAGVTLKNSPVYSPVLMGIPA